MTQVRVTPEVALRETMIENQALRNRVLILAQHVADREARIAELEAVVEQTRPDEPPADQN